MTTYNIFYNSNKEIVWSTTGQVNDAIKAAQASLGYSHVALDLSDDNQPDFNYYVNADATALVLKTEWDFTFSTTTPDIDDVINVTGLPSGTKVYMNGTLQGTMTDTTLTLTVQEPSTYTIKFEKLHYQKHNGTIITVKRYGE